MNDYRWWGRWLLPANARTRVASGSAALACIGLVCAQLALPRAGGRIVDAIAHIDGPDGLGRSVGIFLLAGAFCVLCSSGQQLGFRYTSQRLTMWLRGRLLSKLETASLSSVKQLRRQCRDAFDDQIPVIARFYETALPAFIGSIVSIVGVTWILVLTFGFWALIAFAVIPLYVSLPRIVAPSLLKAEEQAVRSRRRLRAELRQLSAATFDLRLYRVEQWASSRLAAKIKMSSSADWYVALVTQRHMVRYGLSFCVLAALYWIGGQQVETGRLRPGQIVELIGYVALFESPVIRLGQLGDSLDPYRVAADSLRQLLSVTSQAGGFPLNEPSAAPAVRCHDVTFSYPGCDEPAVSNLSIAIKRGEHIAIVGSNGSGKSTLASLILGLDTPSTGVVANRFIALKGRENVGVVLQSSRLISGTIEQNISFGRAHIARADIVALLDQIPLLPTSDIALSAPISGERSGLSKGQRSRILLARALVGRPALVVLDEALGHLDTTGKEHTRRYLRSIAGIATIIHLTHDPEDAANADRVLLMDGGRLRSDGIGLTSSAAAAEQAGAYLKERVS